MYGTVSFSMLKDIISEAKIASAQDYSPELLDPEIGQLIKLQGQSEVEEETL